MSRAKTKEEIQTNLMESIEVAVIFWLERYNVEDMNAKDVMEGLVHSILVMIDGECNSLPAFKLTPNPHKDDKKYFIKTGNNYYPRDVNISGDLHDIWGRRKNKVI